MPLSIRILESEFEVSSDERWLGLLELLWRPFVVDDSVLSEPIPVRIVQEGMGWSLTVEGADPFGNLSPWFIALEMQYQILHRVVRDAAGTVFFHAAGLERDGKILLLTGERGSGKTTLTIELLRKGWSYLSDDVVPLALASAQAEPLPKPLGIKDEERWPEFEHLFGDVWSPRPTSSFSIPASAFPLGARGPVGAVALVEFARTAIPDARLMSRGEAVAVCSEALHPFDRDVLAAVGAFTDKARFVHLSYPSSSAAIELLTQKMTGTWGND